MKQLILTLTTFCISIFNNLLAQNLMEGIIAATTTAAALDKVPEMAGVASALLGSLQYGSGILSTLLLTFFGDGKGNPWTMSWIIALFAVASALTVIGKGIVQVIPKSEKWNRNLAFVKQKVNKYGLQNRLPDDL